MKVVCKHLLFVDDNTFETKVLPKLKSSSFEPITGLDAAQARNSPSLMQNCSDLSEAQLSSLNQEIRAVYGANFSTHRIELASQCCFLNELAGSTEFPSRAQKRWLLRPDPPRMDSVQLHSSQMPLGPFDEEKGTSSAMPARLPHAFTSRPNQFWPVISTQLDQDLSLLRMHLNLPRERE